MKKVIMLLSAAALMFSLASCDETNGDDFDFSNITEDGFYVYGTATGATEVTKPYMMAAGHNEAAENASRNGMFEKYIVLEGGKDFELVYYAAGELTRYSAVLEDFDVRELDNNPDLTVLRGELRTGEDAPAMRVEKTGLYHIVLDLNLENDLLYPQIVVAPVQWGVRGGMNGWGFTAFPEVEYNNTEMTWVLTEQKLAAGGKFKFAYGGGWKIQLDDAGNVKANTNLGEGAQSGTADIAVEKSGTYEITLTYKLAGGAIENSYSYDVKLIKESEIPTTMYIIGNEFGNWDWSAASVVTMTNVYGQEGCFWAIRYMTTATEFKFCALKEWNGDFCTLPTTNEGFITPGNNKVEADGLYLIYVNLVDGIVKVQPAKVWGMGDAFGGWNVETYPFNIAADGKASITTTAAGNLRMYASVPGVGSGDWWQAEFNIYDGQIVYRGNGGDQAAVAVEANKTITLDFNAGTGSIN